MRKLARDLNEGDVIVHPHGNYCPVTVVHVLPNPYTGLLAVFGFTQNNREVRRMFRGLAPDAVLHVRPATPTD